MKFNLFVPCIALLACLISDVQADLILSSEDFQGGAEPGSSASFGFSHTIANWGESAATGFADFIDDQGTGTYGPSNPTDGSNFIVGIQGTGYLYREIGTQSGLESIQIAGEVHRRNDTPQFSPLVVDLISLDASDAFAFQESGNDVVDASTASLVGGFLAAAPGAANTDAVPFSFSYDVSGVADGSRFFVRLQSNGEGLAYVDNLAFSATAVPEPSSFLSICFLGVVFASRRRR